MFTFKSRTTILSAGVMLVLSFLVTLSGAVQATSDMSYCDDAGQCVSVCYSDQGEFVSAGTCHSEDEAASVMDASVCDTKNSGHAIAVIYGTSSDGTPNTTLVTEISLSSIRPITDAERASGEPIRIMEATSTESADLHMVIYWQNEQAGADTDATCKL